MSDNTTAPVQAPPSDDASKTQAPSTDQNAKKSGEVRRPADDKPAGDQSTDQKS